MEKATERFSSLCSAPLVKAAAFLTCFLLSQPVFAQANDAIAQMDTAADTIIGLFTKPFVKVVLAICLCGSAIAFAFNKDNDRIKKNAVAIAISAVILMSATGIVGLVWTK
jgi:hypothetical protein